MPVDQILAVAVAGVGLVLAGWLVISGSRGRVRVLAVIGALLVVVGAIARFAYQWLAGMYLGKLDNELVVTALAGTTLAGGVLTGVGLLLLARAIVIAS